MHAHLDEHLILRRDTVVYNQLLELHLTRLRCKIHVALEAETEAEAEAEATAEEVKS